MRSLLLVSPEDDHAFTAALESGADAIILDLVGAPTHAASRAQSAARLVVRRRRGRAPLLIVRVDPLATGLAGADLDAIVPVRPDGVLLPKAEGGADVMRLSAMLAAREALAGLGDGTIGIIAGATDTPAGLFDLGSYRDSSTRLAGLALGLEDLANALNAAGSRDGSGNLTDLSRLARSLCLAGAAAAGVMAIDAPFLDPDDGAGLEAEAAAARRDGYSAKIAIHPAQVPVINRIFAAD
ncbi:MAG: CoA ester lyase [Bauldia sp.]|nr:MAG: CoA ester lyase [Bauldia sp.]